jgi:hypothetical protein|uniref:Uncharacterized protein n=1 Tax=Mus musculus TaxID=10090 RepID=Q8BGI9_MOUSE|nr:unnamed protein product [Mus musculus]
MPALPVAMLKCGMTGGQVKGGAAILALLLRRGKSLTPRAGFIHRLLRPPPPFFATTEAAIARLARAMLGFEEHASPVPFDLCPGFNSVTEKRIVPLGLKLGLRRADVERIQGGK